MLRAILMTAFLLPTNCAAVDVEMLDGGEEAPKPKAALLHYIVPATVSQALGQLEKQVAAKQDPLVLKIMSQGGDIFAGFAFIIQLEDLKKRNPGTKVVCISDALTFSMAFVVLQSRACDVRLATRRTTFLAHNAVRRANPDPDEPMLKALDRAMAEVVAPRINWTVDLYLELLAIGDWVMTVDQALKIGAIDGIIEPSQVPPVDFL